MCHNTNFKHFLFPPDRPAELFNPDWIILLAIFSTFFSFSFNILHAIPIHFKKHFRFFLATWRTGNILILKHSLMRHCGIVSGFSYVSELELINVPFELKDRNPSHKWVLISLRDNPQGCRSYRKINMSVAAPLTDKICQPCLP